jgi:tripartite-type tricarboxylate transporter receptor subunit TctC
MRILPGLLLSAVGQIPESPLHWRIRSSISRAARTARALLVAATLGIASHAAAQGPGGFPTRPITLVCPFAPGGSADIMARLVAQKLTDVTGRPVVVENRPGAGGMVGATLVARAKPDGYTMLLVTGAYPAAAALAAKPAFDPLKDMTMVSMVTSYPFIINVPPQSPFSTFTDFVAHARKHPGVLNYASSGVGSIGHLTAELLNAMAGIETVHIPTRGGTTALSETMAGRVDFMFEAPTLSLQFIRSGKLRALAATSAARYPVMPDLPTVAESFPGYEVYSFIAVGVTGGTPDPIVQYLNTQLRAALAQPDMTRRLIDLGGEPQGSTVAEINRFVADELVKWQKVIDSRKIERQ